MLEKLSFVQRQRLQYIDFRLMFTGELTRQEIVQRFALGLAAASRDITLYKTYCPNNMHYDNAQKKYSITADFTPLFEHNPKETLMKLTHGITDGQDPVQDIAFPVTAPSALNIPDITCVAKLSQAIMQGLAVKMIYTSLSSGSAAREFVPHNIVDNGLRWHVRGFDRKTQSFRDFVITRITKVDLLTADAKTVMDNETIQHDHQWSRMMPLQIVPHPHNVNFPTAIELDFGMDNGVLEVNVRAAMAGYLLRRWNVDCTLDGTLAGAEYQLYLRNHQTLYGAENLTLAPGYVADANSTHNNKSVYQ